MRTDGDDDSCFVIIVRLVDMSAVLLLASMLMLMIGCDGSTASPSPGLMNNALLWKRLGLNRAIGDEHEGGQPQITSSKKKGESTVYLIKLPPQPHYYIPLNYLPSGNDKDSSSNQLNKQLSGGAKKAISSTPDPFETVFFPPFFSFKKKNK